MNPKPDEHGTDMTMMTNETTAARKPDRWAMPAAVLGAALALVFLTGCGGGPVVDVTSPPETAAQPTGTVTGTTGEPAPGNGSASASVSQPFTGNPAPPMQGQGVETAQPAWNADAERAALVAADDVMRAFTATTLTSSQWQARIKPLLTPRAQQAWSRADLKYFTATSVTGQPRLDEDRSNPYFVWASVPTNDGDYRVHLNRLEPGAPWLGDMIRPLQLKR
jgi:hypothetical protein